MRIVKTIGKLRSILDKARVKGKSIGFVPTMGYFHEGHLTLMRRAKKENDICVVSLYVNPAQFGKGEDLACYPRDIARDSSMAEKENVDILFLPSDNDIYPKGYLTYIDVEQMAETLCGAYRPGHFRGVATVVAKLLNMVQPTVMYLGAKDAQQVAVLKTMVRDLDLPVKIGVVPTVRESDGLAMSSRNVYLSPENRRQAAVLYKALSRARQEIKGGQRSAAAIIRGISKMIAAGRAAKVQYVACVDGNTLKPLKKLQGDILIALAVFFDNTRLIDNVIIRLNEPKKNKS